MFEVQMLIPLAGNDGASFTAEHHAVFESAAVESFGGFTLYPACASGRWVNDAGVDMTDATRIYGFAVASIADGSKVVALAGFAKVLYEQEAIFIRYLGVTEIL
jgi:hypothetical protein